MPESIYQEFSSYLLCAVDTAWCPAGLCEDQLGLLGTDALEKLTNILHVAFLPEKQASDELLALTGQGA